MCNAYLKTLKIYKIDFSKKKKKIMEKVNRLHVLHVQGDVYKLEIIT